MLFIGIAAHDSHDDKISLKYLMVSDKKSGFGADHAFTWVTVFDLILLGATVVWLIAGLNKMVRKGISMQDAAYQRWKAMGEIRHTAETRGGELEEKIHLDDFKAMWQTLLDLGIELSVLHVQQRLSGTLSYTLSPICVHVYIHICMYVCIIVCMHI